MKKEYEDKFRNLLYGYIFQLQDAPSNHAARIEAASHLRQENQQFILHSEEEKDVFVYHLAQMINELAQATCPDDPLYHEVKTLIEQKSQYHLHQEIARLSQLIRTHYAEEVAQSNQLNRWVDFFKQNDEPIAYLYFLGQIDVQAEVSQHPLSQLLQEAEGICVHHLNEIRVQLIKGAPTAPKQLRQMQQILQDIAYIYLWSLHLPMYSKGQLNSVATDTDERIDDLLEHLFSAFNLDLAAHTTAMLKDFALSEHNVLCKIFEAALAGDLNTEQLDTNFQLAQLEHYVPQCPLTPFVEATCIDNTYLPQVSMWVRALQQNNAEIYLRTYPQGIFSGLANKIM